MSRKVLLFVATTARREDDTGLSMAAIVLSPEPERSGVFPGPIVGHQSGVRRLLFGCHSSDGANLLFDLVRRSSREAKLDILLNGNAVRTQMKRGSRPCIHALPSVNGGPHTFTARAGRFDSESFLGKVRRRREWKRKRETKRRNEKSYVHTHAICSGWLFHFIHSPRSCSCSAAAVCWCALARSLSRRSPARAAARTGRTTM